MHTENLPHKASNNIVIVNTNQTKLNTCHDFLKENNLNLKGNPDTF